MYLVKNGKPMGKLYIPANADEVTASAAKSFAEAVALITGALPPIKGFETLAEKNNGVVFATFAQAQGLEVAAEAYGACPKGGFCVKRRGDRVYVLAHEPQGVFFGAHDLLEKNADIVWSRGVAEESVECLPSKDLRLTETDYAESSPFAVRTWNLCGVGSEGREHADEGTAAYIAKNKCNGVSHRIEDGWRKYGLSGAGVAVKDVGNLDDLATAHPEYFMTAPSGGPMPAHGGWDSFLNYYEPAVAEILAKRLAEGMESLAQADVGIWIMPDDPYFCMIRDGKKLHELPFTADDGTTVSPSARNYRSTVYFNFLNRVIKKLNELRPNTYLQVFAYTYSEEAPAIAVDERLIVTLAPIQTNDKYAYTDKRSRDNDGIRDNIEAWSKKAARLALYTYWGSFKGTLYTRPIAEVVKQNLLWLKKLGVYQIEIEGKLDCSYAEDLNAAQKNARKFYDMNEAYVWLMNKLMWTPEADIEALLERYCRIVYKECAAEMQTYFSLLKTGWDEKDALVWYTTGGDVYYLQFILGAGLANKIKETLQSAYEKATTASVKRKLRSICDTVFAEIEKYAHFVKEEAAVSYCGEGEERILAEENLDHVNNADSPWRKAKPLRVLRDYGTMEFYPKEADFSCRMLYDEKNIYVGYTVFDDRLSETAGGENGKICREDGGELISYAETYIGGNILNQSVYYGYISGFTGAREQGGQFYENRGSPKRSPVPEGYAT